MACPEKNAENSTYLRLRRSTMWNVCSVERVKRVKQQTAFKDQIRGWLVDFHISCCNGMFSAEVKSPRWGSSLKWMSQGNIVKTFTLGENFPCERLTVRTVISGEGPTVAREGVYARENWTPHYSPSPVFFAKKNVFFILAQLLLNILQIIDISV